jgi:hypothetical protein
LRRETLPGTKARGAMRRWGVSAALATRVVFRELKSTLYA